VVSFIAYIATTSVIRSGRFTTYFMSLVNIRPSFNQPDLFQYKIAVEISTFY